MKPENNFNQRRDIAIKYCEDQIAWYSIRKFRYRILYQLLQLTIALLSFSSLFVTIFTDNKIIQVLLISGILFSSITNSTFQPKENYIRFAQAYNMLQDHLIKYQTEAHIYRDVSTNKDESLDRFIIAVSTIVMQEAEGWRIRM